MPCLKFSKILFVGLCLVFFEAYAQENNQPAQQQKPSNDQSEWLAVQAKLQVLKSKIRSKTDTVRKLINDKHATSDEKTAVGIVNSLKVEYRDLQIAIREYEEQRNLMNYRFPEKGRSESRTYERMEIKPLEQMETEFSLEGKVKKTVSRLKSAYSNPAVEKKAVEMPPAAAETAKDPSRVSTQESQILSK
jgi:hypothetical protein